MVRLKSLHVARWLRASLSVAFTLLSITDVSARERISVADLSRFAQFGDPMTLDWNAFEDDAHVAITAADGAHSAVVVRGGDPLAATNVSSLYVFETARLMSEGTPILLAQFAASSVHQPIAFVRWLADNQTLVFAGAVGDATPQVYSVNVQTRRLTRLTDLQCQLAWYDVTSDGGRLLTLSRAPTLLPSENPECLQFGCLIQSRTLFEAQSGGTQRITRGEIHDLATGEARVVPDPEGIDSRVHFCDPEYAGGISSNGRFALRFCRLHVDRLREVPDWGQYAMDPYYAEAHRTGNARAWRVGFVVDLETGDTQRWTDAPSPNIAAASAPLWIDRGERAILPAAFEPLAGQATAERDIRRRQYVVQLLDPRTRRVTRIARLAPEVAGVISATWDSTTQVLTIVGRDTNQHTLAPVYFRRVAGRWSASPVPGRSRESSLDRMRLVVDQSLNERPRLYAADASSGQRRLLLDANPWLADRDVGRVEAIQWSGCDGRVWHGGLIYPLDFRSGHRYPLFIQTHGFRSERFSLSGVARNFPGQALAAQGVMVLQADEETVGYDDAGARAGYEGAIDHLDRLGLIDRDRVGIVGWSASGPTAASMLTHSEYPIAAAAFTDTATYGWWFDLHSGDLPDLSAVLERSPTSHFARVRSPLLIWAAAGISADWEWYAALRSQNQPVEFWFLPTGTHDVYQPTQRLRMNQSLVDWFVFWLRDEVRTETVSWGNEAAAGLATRYERWREFRRQQEQRLAQPRPPLLQWTASPRGGELTDK